MVAVLDPLADGTRRRHGSPHPCRRQGTDLQRPHRPPSHLRPARWISPRRSSPSAVCAALATAFPDGFVTLDLDGRAATNKEPQQATAIPAGGSPSSPFDTSFDGIVPVARNHAQLIAGGLAVMLESRAERDAVILTTVMMGSFAGLAAGDRPVAAERRTLALHHPFDAAVLASAMRGPARCSIVNLPATLLPALADSGRLRKSQGRKRRSLRFGARLSGWRNHGAGSAARRVWSISRHSAKSA